MRVNEKYIREYYIENVIGHDLHDELSRRTLLPHNDRRHYVAFSECKARDFSDDYWQKLWSWISTKMASRTSLPTCMPLI